MELSWTAYLFAILGGILAGIINTLAGSGSAITLPILVMMGLPANVANATNRVGVTIQNIVGIATFKSKGQLELEGGLWYVIPALPGAVIGAMIAAELNEQLMNYAIGTVMVILLVLVLFKPQQWLKKVSEVKEGRPSFAMMALFFAIGIYGGFIQAGVGVFLLTALVVGVGYNLTHANAIKLMIVLSITVVALAVFIYQDLVIWRIGLLMAVGQSIGAWAAATFAVSAENANVWVRRLLIAVIVFSIFKFFGIFELIMGWIG